MQECKNAQSLKCVQSLKCEQTLKCKLSLIERRARRATFLYTPVAVTRLGRWSVVGGGGRWSVVVVVVSGRWWGGVGYAPHVMGWSAVDQGVKTDG
jgi:hypothetical protein